MHKFAGRLAILVIFFAKPLVACAAPDFSEPRKTVAHFNKRLQARDAETLRACFDGANTKNDVTQAYLDSWVATFRFQDVMEKKFGQSAADAVRSAEPNPAFNAQKSNWQEAGTLTVNGDTAILTLEPNTKTNPPTEPAPIHFKRTNGQWKMDAATLADMNDPKVAERVKLMMQITGVMKDVTEEINNGKLVAAQQAQQALVQRVVAILHPAGATSAPATAPAASRASAQ